VDRFIPQSNFYSNDIHNFIEEHNREYCRLGILGNSYLTKFLGRLTITEHGIDLDQIRYDSQASMAEYLGCSLSSIGRVEAKLVELGLLIKKNGRHPSNPFRRIRTLTLSSDIKKNIAVYVKNKLGNKPDKQGDLVFHSYIEEKMFSALIDVFPRDFIKIQHPIGKYRADFMLIHEGRKLVIECDGHQFHEKSAWQAAHDKKRDRFMQSKGFHVFRFTGTEINRNIKNCLSEVKKYFDIPY
jgi:very-short-patch-repair endonuclease